MLNKFVNQKYRYVVIIVSVPRSDPMLPRDLTAATIQAAAGKPATIKAACPVFMFMGDVLPVS